MKRIKRIKNRFFQTALYRIYGDLKIKYKLTAYFLFFGIIISAFSFLIFRTEATYNFNKIAALAVRSSLEKSDLPDDFIFKIAGTDYYAIQREAFPFKRILENEVFVAQGVIWFKIYYSEKGAKGWQELALRRGVAAGFKPAETVPFGAEDDVFRNAPFLFSRLAVFWGKNVSVWINLTRPGDEHRYVMELRINREGLVDLAGGGEAVFIYFMLIAGFAFILSHLSSGFIARPVNDLNRQAAMIASGDFNAKTKQFRRDEIGELSESLNSMADKIENYINDLNERMNGISIMNKIDRAVLATTSRHDLVERVTSFVSELFIDCTVTLIIEDMGNERYHLLTHFEKGTNSVKSVKPFVYHKDLGEEIVYRNRSFYSVDIKNDHGTLLFLNRFLGRNFFSAVNLPLYIDGVYHGSLLVGSETGVHFTESQEQILKALADQVGVAMKSLRFIEEKEELYLGILQALSQTIDAKSKWTAGHSSRVALCSKKIALNLGLEKGFIEDLEIASALHDIGKIGVPEYLLDKPGKLSDDEFDIIKSHPSGGALIVKSIPGSERFIKGVLFHHEHWDGSGYPDGLRGEDIPLMARILAAADMYDAVVSQRPYRAGMGHDESLLLLEYEKGRKLDPLIAEVLISIIKIENNDFFSGEDKKTE